MSKNDDDDTPHYKRQLYDLLAQLVKLSASRRPTLAVDNGNKKLSHVDSLPDV